jgi:hypothetical protein
MKTLLAGVLLGSMAIPALPAQRLTVSYSIDFATPAVTFTYGLWGDPLTTGGILFATRSAPGIPLEPHGFLGTLYLPVEDSIFVPGSGQLALDAMGHATFRYKALGASAAQGAYVDLQASRLRMTDNFVLTAAWTRTDAKQVLAATFNSETKHLKVGGRYAPGADLTVYGRKSSKDPWGLLTTIAGSLTGSVDSTMTLQGFQPGNEVEVRAGKAVLMHLQ